MTKQQSQQDNHRHQIRKRENDTEESKQKINEIQKAIKTIEDEILKNAQEKDQLEKEAITEEETFREKEDTKWNLN